MEYAKREDYYIANLKLSDVNNLFSKWGCVYREALIYNG